MPIISPGSVKALRRHALKATTRAHIASQDAARAPILQSQRNRLLLERNRIEGDLTTLRETLGVRVLSAYWELVKRLIPEDSIGRELYRHAMAFPKSLLLGVGGRSTTVRISDFGTPFGDLWGVLRASRMNEAAYVATSDSRVDLVQFDELANSKASSRVVVIFSTAQLIRSEGQRATNLAFELACRGIPVVFCYWRWDESVSTSQDSFNEGILQLPIDVVLAHPTELLDAFPEKERIAIFEFPYPRFFPLVSSANSLGWITVYDIIDDWEGFHEVGMAPWFDPDFEAHMVNAVDLVFAVKRSLSAKAERLGRDEVAVVPNAVRRGIEHFESAMPLERGEITIGYFGHLSSAWFDWRIIVDAARLRPKWRFQIIGYGAPSVRADLPDNIDVLGRIPQELLASYAANWDVAVVPFKPGRVADGTDAIKTYEYLAMDLPVVVTGIGAPEGAESLVTRASDLGDLLLKLERAALNRADSASERRQFAAHSTWEFRVDAILRHIAEGAQRVSEKRQLSGMGK
jgi:glycosyltransferase involved in cell wall biosynthesis